MPKKPEELEVKMPGIAVAARGWVALIVAVPVGMILLVVAWRLLVG